ncbi:aspartyl/glutamyl-tRNA amidotransferase subunit A [Klebsiella pneumoniae]|nr:aspartyl/glutamyl-tRNA amidotransferase subunit A [Klebsiella pneumoniae]
MTLQHFTIADLQRALHEGELSAREIARQTLDDIARVNPQINAWTEVTAQRMLAEADSIDALRREKRPLPPLAGIPYAVKNLFDVAGHTTLAGAELLSDRPPAASDSWAVRQLHSAGALLSGMLNMDAYAYGFTTENSYYGATRNPARSVADRRRFFRRFGPRRWRPGWFISASAATTNGSIRVPASLCGIFGLKPTFGRLSRSGSHPFVASLDHIGPFARRVTDLAAVYDALQGRDPADDFQADKASERTGNLLERGLEGLRCARLGGYFTTWCDDDARAAVDRVAQRAGRRQRAAVRGCRAGPLGGLYHQRQRRRQSVPGGSSPLARAL